MRRLAMPFVATLAVTVGCTKSSDNVAPLPPSPTSSTDPDTPPSVAASDLTYDGYGSCYRTIDGEKKYEKCPASLLPAPSNDELVYRHGEHCQQVPDGKTVRCPDTGPTAILPDPSAIKTGSTTVSLHYGSLDCHRSEDEHCPPKVACNPPAPVPVPCPPALMPKLAKGVKPTKVDGARCFYGRVEVVCPKP